MKTTVGEAKKVCKNVGSLIYWRPDGTGRNMKKPDTDVAFVLNQGEDIPYVVPKFQ